MNKNHQNKNDRKRQRRKDFSHGRDRTATPQDQRSTYPKSSLALRADADRRAQIAGIRTNLPTASWRTINAIDPGIDIDLRPGAINAIPSPSITADMIRMMRDIMDQQMLTKMIYGVGPSMLGLDLGIERRPDLHREMKIGEILAYRCWRYDAPLLRSVYMHDVWRPNQIIEAREIEDWSERGVHAWKDLNSKKFNDYVRGYLSTQRDPWRMLRHEHEPPTIIVTGTVLLWGDVVEHEHGYRAEFAKINSIDWLYPDATLMGRERETLAQLRQLYDVS